MDEFERLYKAQWVVVKTRKVLYKSSPFTIRCSSYLWTGHQNTQQMAEAMFQGDNMKSLESLYKNTVGVTFIKATRGQLLRERTGNLHTHTALSSASVCISTASYSVYIIMQM